MKFILVLTILFRFGNYINCDEGNDQSKLFNVDKSTEHNNHYALESDKLKNPAINTQSLTTNKNNILNLNNFHQTNPSSAKTDEFVNFFSNQPLQPINFAFSDNKPSMNYIINKQGGRRSFTNRIKSFVNSLLWKDSSNSYLPSDSTNFFSFKQLPSFKVLNPSINDQTSISSLRENFANLAFKSQNKPNNFQNFDFFNDYKSFTNSFNLKPNKFIANSVNNKLNNYQNDGFNYQTNNLYSSSENKNTNSQYQQLSNNLNSKVNSVNPYPRVTNIQNYKNDFNENNQNEKNLNNIIKNSDGLIVKIDSNFMKALQ